jgi:soluble lytic murein transglycosylase-like protein
MSRFWLILLLGLAGGCGRQAAPVDTPTRVEIWAAIQPLAERYRIEPTFIYALAAAESNFDPKARNGEARGLLQIKPAAWAMVAAAPYEPTVWDWRANLETGIEYLAYARSNLHRQKKFSYPRLLAAFHYGPEYLEARDFDLERIEVPANEIYRQLWRGNLSPVPPPISR